MRVPLSSSTGIILLLVCVLTSPPADDVRVWLVDRGYNNRDLVILQYATLEGEEVYRKEVASQALGTVTAAKDYPPAISEPLMSQSFGNSTLPKLREWPRNTVPMTRSDRRA